MSHFGEAPTIKIGQALNRSGVTKGVALNNAQRSGAAIDTSVKGKGQGRGPEDHSRIARLAEDDAPKPPATVGMVVGRAMINGRMRKVKPDGKPTSQKDLAVALNCKVQDIADIESGKAKPDQALLGKAERYLNTKLRGAESGIGKDLHPPKK